MFSAATKQEFKENISNIKQRLRIQQLVLAGKIGDAIQLTMRLYPEVLSENTNLFFALKCRQFIEMIAEGAHALNHNNSSPHSSSASSPATNGSSSNASSSELNGNSNSNNNDHMDVDDEYTNDSNSSANKLNTVIKFGKDLHQLAQSLKSKNGSDERNKKMLQEAFSLMAYSDPRASPVGYQLDPSEREGVCQALNTAIVIHEMGNGHQRPPLEEIISHSKKLLKLNGQCGAWLLEQL